MNWKHLLWIVPLVLLIGYFIGIYDVMYTIRTNSNIEFLCQLMVNTKVK
jgi:hypothetical protein